jgi:hypothetical protein
MHLLLVWRSSILVLVEDLDMPIGKTVEEEEEDEVF